MNEAVNKFLLAGDKRILEIHLRQLEFAYSACRPFTKIKERKQKFKETGHSRYIYQNKLDKACFQHDMAYEDFKDLTRRTVVDKIIHDKVFNITKNQNMMDINIDLLQWPINFLIKNLLIKMKICQTKS